MIHSHEGSPLPDFFVMDAMANDLESVDDLVRILNSESELGWTDVWGRLFTYQDVVAALTRLIQQDLVHAYAADEHETNLVQVPLASVRPDGDGVYFGLSERGRSAHASWDAPLS